MKELIFPHFSPHSRQNRVETKEDLPFPFPLSFLSSSEIK
jgi:hypothetical protein